MSWRPDRYAALRALLGGPRVDEEVRAEFEHHLAERIAANLKRGMSAEAARADAERRFGDVIRFAKETVAIEQSMVRERRRMEFLDALRRELRHAWRGALRSPGFSLVAVLTLGLGLGASTAVYTLLDAVVLNPLPYPNSRELVLIQHAVPGVQADAKWGFSAANWFHYRERARTLADLAVYRGGDANVRSEREATHASVVVGSGNLFSVLGARPAIGRLLTTADNLAGAPAVVVLANAYWRSSFGGAATVVGKTLSVDGTPYEIVGVAERGFDLPEHDTDVFVPRRLDPAGPFYNDHGMSAIARLRPGITLASAQLELQQLMRGLPERYPTVYYEGFFENTGFSPVITDLRSAVVGSTAKTLWILFGSVAVVLLIAAANVANLFLVRVESRRNEIAVRSALGAERGHLFVQSFAEALLITLAAAALGLWLAFSALRFLVRHPPGGLPRLAEVQLDAGAIGFAIAAALVAGLVFSVFPLLRQRANHDSLRAGGRLTTSRAQLRVRSTLVALQVALAIVLLSAAGLMLRSFARMRAVDIGIDPHNVLAVDVYLPFQQYNSHDQATLYWRTLSEQLRVLPGVTAVGTVLTVPLSTTTSGCAVMRARPAAVEGEFLGCLGTNVITPGYFEALGIRVRGRVPTWQDVDAGTGAVVITNTLARRLWPNEDALGHGIKVNSGDDTFYEIVGVSDDVRAEGVNRPVKAMVFYPATPLPGAPLWQARNAMTVLVRTAMDRPEQLASAVRRAATRLEPAAAIGRVETVEHIVLRSMASTSFTMVLLAIAGAMALLISIVGLYGVIAYTVNRRRAELGVRLALGARASEVGAMVVTQSVGLAAVGVVIGLFGSLLTMGLLNSLLYEVRPTDPLTLTLVSFTLLAVAALASLLPARRAAAVSPVEALRAQ